MPAIPPFPRVLVPRDIPSDPEPSNRKGGIIAGVAILIILVVALGIVVKLQALPWYRASQAAKAARKKAIAD
jgi:hypothetical protein